MDIIKVGFAGDAGALSTIIKDVTGGEWCNISHAYLYDFMGGVYEAMGVKLDNDLYAGVWVHPNSSRDITDKSLNRLVSIEVPNMQAALEKAQELLGTPYGYTDCVSAAVFLATGEQIGDGEATCMCSETVTRILRAGGVSILPDLKADVINPAMLYKELLKIGGKLEC